MSKLKTVYECSECGGTTAKWQGQCPHCQAWNTLTETVAVKETSKNSRYQALAPTSEVVNLSSVEAVQTPRLMTGIGELDRVLGGGLVAGGVVLLGGDPGIGKSTLLLQTLTSLSEKGVSSLYVSGEESANQIALRASRLGFAQVDISLQAEIRLPMILQTLQQRRPQVAVIDSIQTIYDDDFSSAPGSVTQVRECAAKLVQFAKQSGTCLLLIGHVTKDGHLAGPRVLEHIVDAVLQFEGDSHSSFRLVRALKNRFGAVNELGVFAMTERGLKGVSNPSAIFLSQHTEPVAGSCIMATLEGTRPMLVEIQALVDKSYIPQAKRLSVGLEATRLSMLLAVLHRHAGVACFDQDVFVNAVGGVRISEPASDLAVLCAVVSSLRNRPLPRGLVVFGEVGLAGEIRPAPRGQERLKEAAKLGFEIAIIPKANAPKQGSGDIKIIAVERVDEALDALREVA
jgi:DNA repair protein RadA/Sms